MRPELLSCLIKLKRLRYLGLGFVYFPKGKVNTRAIEISKNIRKKKSSRNIGEYYVIKGNRKREKQVG